MLAAGTAGGKGCRQIVKNVKKWIDSKERADSNREIMRTCHILDNGDRRKVLGVFPRKA